MTERQVFTIKIMTLSIWGDNHEAKSEEGVSFYVKEYMDDVYNFSRWMLSDPQEADDITSETFISFFENFDKLDKSKPLKPWLLKVARNKCLDHIKRKKSTPFSQVEEQVLTVPDEDPSIEAMFDSTEFVEKVKGFISEFNPDVKEVLLLKYFEEFTFSEIADTLGIPENTAKSHFYRAQSILYKRVKEITHA